MYSHNLKLAVNSKLHLLYCQAHMPEMTFGALFSCTYNINTPFKEIIKALVRVFLIDLLVSLYKSLQLSKEFFNGI
jgi:hypothetical protein